MQTNNEELVDEIIRLGTLNKILVSCEKILVKLKKFILKNFVGFYVSL